MNSKLEWLLANRQVRGAIDYIFPKMSAVDKAVLNVAVSGAEENMQVSLLIGLRGNVFSKLLSAQTSEYLKNPDKLIVSARDVLKTTSVQLDILQTIEDAYSRYQQVYKPVATNVHKALDDAEKEYSNVEKLAAKLFEAETNEARLERDAATRPLNELLKAATEEPEKQHEARLQRSRQKCDKDIKQVKETYAAEEEKIIGKYHADLLQAEENFAKGKFTEEQFAGEKKRAEEEYFACEELIKRRYETLKKQAGNEACSEYCQALAVYNALCETVNKECNAALAPIYKEYRAKVKPAESRKFAMTRPAHLRKEVKRIELLDHLCAVNKQATADFFKEVMPLLQLLSNIDANKLLFSLKEGGGIMFGEDLRNLVRLVNTFGNQSEMWLTEQAKRGINLHDASEWLPLQPASELKGLGEYLMPLRAKNIRLLRLVAGNWSEVALEDRQLPLDELFDKIVSRVYRNVQVPDFARESAINGIRESRYNELENIYTKSLSVPSPFPLNLQWESAGLTGRFWPRSDVRGMFLGHYTHCCQHPQGGGRECALYGQSSPNAGFFVVTNARGEILAQSFTWVSANRGVCFDNIEAVKLGSRAPAVTAVYEAAAKYLTEKAGYKRVTVGTHNTDINVSHLPPAGKKKLAIPADYVAQRGLTDATQQVIMSEATK